MQWRAGPDVSVPGAETGPPTVGPPVLPARQVSEALLVGPADRPDAFELLADGVAGGEGVTWQARYRGALDTPLPLAIKMLHRPLDAADDWPTARDRQRWQDHIVLLQHLRLEHVVKVNEIFTGPPPHIAGAADDAAREAVYLSMEWLDGPTLAELIAGRAAGAATIVQRARFVADVARAVAGLHEASRQAGNPALHRDVKPSNCIVTQARGVVLIDVSTMRLLNDGIDPLGLHTAGYTAPEVLRSPRTARQPAADLYALGAVAVFCLLGADPPPSGTAVVELVADRLVAVLRDARVAEAEAAVAHVLKMLDSDPGGRPGDAVAWADTLSRLVTPAGPDPTASLDAGDRADTTRPARYDRRLVAGAAALLAAVLAVATQQQWWRGGGASLRTGSAGATREAPATHAGVPVSQLAAPPTASTAASPTSAAAAPSGASTVPVTPSNPPGLPRATPPQPTPPPTTQAAVSTATITAPADNTTVPQCAYFSGAAELTPGMTLILVMRNLDNGDPNRYVQYVFGWSNPATLSSWRGAQYFGKKGDTGGQRYRVELAVVSLAAARAASGDAAAMNALAGQSTTMASRTLRRVTGEGPGDCLGP